MNARLRSFILIANALGAAGSLAAVLYVGRHNASIVLQLLFVIWVLSPFAGFALARRWAKALSVRRQTALYAAMLLVALISLAVYGHTAVSSPSKPAFVFLMVPLGSWLLLAVVAAGAQWSKRSAHAAPGGSVGDE